MNNEKTREERVVNTLFLLVLGILIGAMISIPTATYIANRKSARLVSELEQKVAKLEKGPGDTAQQDTGPGDTGPKEEELDNTPSKVVEDTNKNPNPDMSSNGQQGGGIMKMNMTNTSSSKPQPNLIKVLKDTNLYSRPDDESKAVGKAKKGENLTFLKEAGDGWLECTKEKEHDKIYIYYYYTSYQNPGREETMPKTGASVFKTAWLRETPGLSGKLKKKINKDTDVEILAVVDIVKDAYDYWYLIKIRKTKDIGYVHNSVLDIDIAVYSNTEERIEDANKLVSKYSFTKAPDENSTAEPATATVSPTETINPTAEPATATASPQATDNPTSVPATATASPQVTNNPTATPATATASPQVTINPTSEPTTATVSPTETINPTSLPALVDVSSIGTFSLMMNYRKEMFLRFAPATAGAITTEESNAPVTGGAITTEENAPVTGDAIASEEGNAPVTGGAIVAEENAPTTSGDVVAEVKEETANKEEKKYTVTIINATTLYKEVDRNSEAIANLQAGDKVTDVTEAGKGWLKGNVNGSEGHFYYLHTTFCKVANKEATEKEKYKKNKVAVITANGVNVRTAPSITAKVVDCVNAGTTFEAKASVQIMDGEEKGWCEISVNGKKLYVYNEYVKIKDKEDENKKEEKKDAPKIPQRSSNKNEADNKEKQEVVEDKMKKQKGSSKVEVEDNEVVLLAKVMIAEAGGSGDAEMKYVGQSLLNRVNKNGSNLKKELTKPNQYPLTWKKICEGRIKSNSHVEKLALALLEGENGFEGSPAPKSDWNKIVYQTQTRASWATEVFRTKHHHYSK